MGLITAIDAGLRALPATAQVRRTAGCPKPARLALGMCAHAGHACRPARGRSARTPAPPAPCAPPRRWHANRASTLHRRCAWPTATWPQLTSWHRPSSTPTRVPWPTLAAVSVGMQRQRGCGAARGRDWRAAPCACGAGAAGPHHQPAPCRHRTFRHPVHADTVAARRRLNLPQTVPSWTCQRWGRSWASLRAWCGAGLRRGARSASETRRVLRATAAAGPGRWSSLVAAQGTAKLGRAALPACLPALRPADRGAAPPGHPPRADPRVPGLGAHQGLWPRHLARVRRPRPAVTVPAPVSIAGPALRQTGVAQFHAPFRACECLTLNAQRRQRCYCRRSPI